MRRSSRSWTYERPTRSTILGIVAGSALLLAVLLLAPGLAFPSARAEWTQAGLRRAGQKPATVPVSRGEDLPYAYLKLHAAGLSVTFTRSFSLDWSSECMPVVVRSIPRAGARVRRGSVVTLITRIPGCGLASPFTVVGTRPRRVPDFVGKPLTAAIHWIQRRHLFWAATIPQLRAGDAFSLFGNYTVGAQSPHPGSTILPVVKEQGGVLPTPLSLTVRRSRAPSPPAVSLVLPAGQALHPGESVPVTVANDSDSPIYRSDCLVLARLDAGGWRPVLDSHGVNVACVIRIGEVQNRHSRQPDELPLYDDLHPGTYRITLYYRPTPRHWKVLKALTRRDRSVHLQFTIGPAPAQPEPQLSEKRIFRIALTAAKHAQDPHPSLIQHAAGTHFKAVLIGQGDIVFEWNWSYLIAIRGHFIYSNVGGPGSPAPIHGTVITLVVDAGTGEITDAGLSNRYPPLARLGKVTTDLRR
jgi:hypothetical protein